MDTAASTPPRKASGNAAVGMGSLRVLGNMSNQGAKSSPAPKPRVVPAPAKIASDVPLDYKGVGPNNGDVMPHMTPVPLPPRPSAPQASVLPQAPVPSTAPPAKKRRLLENPHLQEAQRQWEEGRDLRTPDTQYMNQGLPSSSSGVDRKFAP